MLALTLELMLELVLALVLLLVRESSRPPRISTAAAEPDEMALSTRQRPPVALAALATQLVAAALSARGVVTCMSRESSSHAASSAALSKRRFDKKPAWSQ